MKTLQPPADRRLTRGCVAVFALVWLGITGISLVGVGLPLVLALTSGEGKTDAIVPMLIGLVFTVPFCAVGIGLLVWSLGPLIAGLKVTRPEVSVSSTAVRPGDSFSFSFRQAFKSAAEVKRASLQLVLRETAIYRRGTNTYTATHEVVAQQFETQPRRFEAGEVFSEQRLLEIPPDAMHTFAAAHNKLRWIVKVQIGVSGWPDFKEEYEVQVLPERS